MMDQLILLLSVVCFRDSSVYCGDIMLFHHGAKAKLTGMSWLCVRVWVNML